MIHESIPGIGSRSFGEGGGEVGPPPTGQSHLYNTQCYYFTTPLSASKE